MSRYVALTADNGRESAADFELQRNCGHKFPRPSAWLNSGAPNGVDCALNSVHDHCPTGYKACYVEAILHQLHQIHRAHDDISLLAFP